MNASWRVEDLSPQERRALLDQLLAAEAGPPVERDEPAPDLHPCSFGQERVWFLQKLDPAGIAYNECKAVRLRGPLDAAALQRALDALVERHESLRTTFVEIAGAPMQRIAPASPMPMPRVEATGATCEDRLDATIAMIRDEVAKPFDMARGPLVRAAVYPIDVDDHVFVLFLHHVIMDGWSMEVLADELARLYAGIVAGADVQLPPLEVQYVDFAAWQRETFAAGALSDDIAYWKTALAGAPELLALPTDRPRPAAQTYRGGSFGFTIPVELADRIRASAREQGATFFMFALAAFDVLLMRHSGQTDIVVGMPTAGRPRVETERVIGFFANTLALRTDLAGEPSFREALRRVRAACLDGFSREHVPFERIVQELAPRRDPGRSPIFQVMISLDRGTASDLRLPGLDSATLPVNRGSAKFDLLLLLRDGGGGAVDCELEYRSDLFDAATVERMAQRLLMLLDSATAAPDTAITRLPMLGIAEGRQIEQFNATGFDFGDEAKRGLHELFEAQVARTPDSVAVWFAADHLTYAQLNERADRLADQLRQAGVGVDVLVGVFMERSIEMVVALLAVLKAGGAYVPIDPGYPAGRVAFMIDDSAATVILTQANLRDRVPQAKAKVIAVERDDGLSSGRALPSSGTSRSVTNTSRLAVDASDLAYVIYTSGSTGRPKGVAVPHRAIVNHMLWMRRDFPLSPGDRVLQKTPTSFDASVWEFYAPLIGGAELVMAAPDIQRSPRDLVAAVIEHRITTLQLVPTMLEAMLDEPSLRRCVTLKRVFCGGEALATHLVTRLRAALPAVEVINLYGPTEAAIDATIWRCMPGDESLPTQPIGKPIDNMRTHVLDARMKPQPIGVPGELYLGGAGLARGYVNRPELTAERFVPDPMSHRPGDRLYKTGDLARLRGDGALEFLSRVDHQVKLRGHRIELGEIEAVLARQPGVAACVVVVCEDVPSSPLLAAYIVRTSPGVAEAAETRDAMRRELPDYMVPAAFVFLDAFPRLPSGKIDRAALPAPQRSSAMSSTDESPRNATEESLARIWREVLKVDRVGIHESFFDLGGHSLLAAQVVARVRDAMNVELPLRAMFESPTIAGLAAVMALMPAAKPGAGPIKRIDRGARGRG